MNENIIFELFLILGYKIKSIDDLFSLSIPQDKIKEKKIIENMYEKIDELKNKYKSNMLTCLHKNSLEKQKFPALNMIRQICKCNNIKVFPQVISKGYDKSSGKKITERYYQMKYII